MARHADAPHIPVNGGPLHSKGIRKGSVARQRDRALGFPGRVDDV